MGIIPPIFPVVVEFQLKSPVSTKRIPQSVSKEFPS